MSYILGYIVSTMGVYSINPAVGVIGGELGEHS